MAVKTKLANRCIQPKTSFLLHHLSVRDYTNAFIKNQAHYTEAIGKTLNILTPKATPVDLDSLQPVLSVKFVNDQPFLDWAKAGMEALELEVDRGNGFTLLTIDTHPGHLDTAPLPAPGTTALWRYRGIYRLKDQRVGQWSAVLEVAVKGV